MTMPVAEPVAVTGLGGLCAAGGSVPELTETLFAGQRRVQWRTLCGQRYPVYQLDEQTAPSGYWEGLECERCGRLGIQAAKEALQQAGLTLTDLESLTVGICLGTTVGSAMNNEAFYSAYRRGLMPDVAPVTAYLQSNPADMLARALKTHGPCQTVTNACSSGSVAIGHAAAWIRSGLCDVALAGGADMLCNVIHAGFRSLLITDSEPCRPFDRRRQGLTLGEGAGVVVLESERSACQRHVPVQAYLCGYGNASDAYHMSGPEPTGRGLRCALAQALAQAQVTAADISFINAHGTGTSENDRVEGRLFSELFPQTPFGSTKGYTGHTLGAAGGLEAVMTIACLQAGQIPASLGFEEPDPEFAARPVAENTLVAGGYGLSDSVAFGGNNAVLIFRRPEP